MIQELLERVNEGIRDFQKRRPGEDCSQATNTGIPSLDVRIGGLPRGLTEIVSSDSSLGSTSLAIQCCKEVSQNGIVLWFPMEQVLDTRILKHRGVNCNNVYSCKTIGSEDLLSTIKELGKDVSLIIIDSLPSLTNSEEFTNNEYKYLYKSYRDILVKLPEYSECSVLLLNQVRSSIFKKDVSVGSIHVNHHSKMKISLENINLVNTRFIPTGRIIKFVVEKSWDPFNELTFNLELDFREGFRTDLDLLNLLLKYSVVERRGVWFYHGKELLGRDRKGVASSLDTKKYLSTLKEKIDNGNHC